MPPRIVVPTTNAATITTDGLLPAALYQLLTETPPPVSDAAVPTNGATGSYVLANLTATSSIDPTITDLACRYCYGTAATAGTLKILLLCPGYAQPASQFTDAQLKRIADYYGIDTGHRFVVVAITMRGHGQAGETQDLARDTYDMLDLVRAVSTALGSLIWGSGDTFFAVGFSTGALNALQAACRLTDHVNGIACIASNGDIGRDPHDSYWGRGNATTRADLINVVGDRAEGFVADVDPYTARDVYRAIGRLIDLLHIPVVIAGDLDETEAIPTVTRLVAACRSTAGGRACTQTIITQTGDAVRVLHSGGVNGAGAQLVELDWAPRFLAVTEERYMPAKSSPANLGLVGWMRKRQITGDAPEAFWEFWTGANTNPRLDPVGGRLHAGEIEWCTACREFTFTPIVSAAGHAQIILDDDENRRAAFNAGATTFFDLNLALPPPLPDGIFEHDFAADESTTLNGALVTAWGEAAGFGALSYPAPLGFEPTLITDVNGSKAIRFASTSPFVGKHFIASSLFVDPRQDFTVAVAFNKTNATTQTLIDFIHSGDASELQINWNSGFTFLHYILSSGSTGAPDTGPGGLALNTIHYLVAVREGTTLKMMVDGLAIVSGTITADTYTATAPSKSSVGCALSGGNGDAVYNSFDGDVYEVAFAQAARSPADMLTIMAALQARWPQLP